MNNSVVRSNRINDLFKYAIKLAQNPSETHESIYEKVQQKAELVVSKQTAIQYTNAVFDRIDRLR